ncbi:DegT/DnrJ/EryC1/StrS family aminotransferase [Alphaproteobacteria bacterium]|nr:DegT/DnrJ/EryC1/StrS family aminotransferase [Alphaproteobacteria bacterium]
MKVHYNYLPEEFANYEDIFEDWKKLIASSQFTLGPFLQDFEKKFARFIKAKHCIAVNNGTDALILCLRAAGIGNGDEVITVANTFYATVGAIVAVGATPVLVDCDNRFQISPDSLAKAINRRTKAVMPVHWGGASPDMDKILSISNENGLIIIEDACMGIGASVNGKSPGTFGLVNAFSMHPLKSLNAMGDGGVVATDDDSLAEWMRKYRNHGMVNRDSIEFWGVNMRMQPLQCIVLSHGLDRLDKTIQQRNSNANILDEQLQQCPGVTLPKRQHGCVETFALYMGLFERRDELIEYLEAKGIEAKIHYPRALHQQKAAAKTCIFDEKALRNATYQSNHLVTLPVHQFLGENHMRYTADTIQSFYERST